jgi:Methyltransferase domain
VRFRTPSQFINGHPYNAGMKDKKATKKATQKQLASNPTNSVAQRPEEVHEHQSIELLKALHILTVDGKLNQDSRRKLKQVYHLFQFIEPLLKDAYTKTATPILVDHGAGKSYLGFLLYDLFLKQRAGGQVVGIETRTELIEKSVTLALKLGFARMNFLNLSAEQSISTPELPAKIDIVTALHACNTATDDAISFGIAKKASHMVLVPCCQAEVAAILKKNKNQTFAKTPLSELWRHPVHTREMGSQITNVLRCLRLEAAGFEVMVTELVGWEHSLKNELIVATFVGRKRSNAVQRIEEILDQMSLTDLRSRFIDAT